MKEIKNQIEYFKLQNIIFVFFTVNPLTTLISKLIIDHFQLKKNQILIVSFRQTPTDLLEYQTLSIKLRRIEIILQKLLFDSMGGRKVLKHLNSDFVLFTSWAYRETNWLLKSKKCKGHFYVEEGQGSYMPYQMFNYQKLSLATRIKNNFKNRVNKGDGSGYFYRNDTNGFIGLHPICFPKIDKKKKYLLSNYTVLKEFYQPKIKGIQHIALGCAERRLINGDWENMLAKLISVLPKEGLVKLHPSFYTRQNKITEIKSYLADKTNNLIQLCDRDVILEIEMLYEEKIIYGPQTTLSFYADYFGSDFKTISFS